MMTLLDRLARAMCDCDAEWTWGTATNTVKDAYRDQARFALKVVCDALREPIENWPEELRDALSLAVARASADEEELVSEAVLRALADHLQGEGE